MALSLGFRLSIQGLCLVLTFKYHIQVVKIQVFRFRYSGLEFRFGYTGLGITG